MKQIYDKAAIQEYMHDISNVGVSLRRIQDESVAQYNACKQKYARLCAEAEQASREAYNMIEAAESLQRAANAEYEAAMRRFQNAEDSSEQESAQAQLRVARMHQAEAARELSVATAAYAKAQENVNRLSEVWGRYQPVAEAAASKVEYGLSSFYTVVDNGNRDLGEYISIMEKARDALYDDSSSTLSSSGAASHTAATHGGGNGAPRSSLLRTGAGNTLGLTTAAGVTSLVMNIGGQEYTFPNTKSGAAKAYRTALQNGDAEMITQTNAAFRASSPEAYLNAFSAAGVSSSVTTGEVSHVQYTKCVTVPYTIRTETGDQMKLTYDMPIVYDGRMEGPLNTALSFGTDADAAQKWAHSAFSEWRASISEDAEDAFITYSSTMDYEDINAANRGLIPMTKGIKRISDGMDSGLDMAHIPEEVVVYRGISEGAVVDMAMKAGGKLESGIVLEDGGYLSTSLVSNTKFTQDAKYVLRLTAVQGLHGAPLEYGDLSNIPNESELLFGRNHCIYVKSVSEVRRNELIPGSNEEWITLIDGILTK